RAFAATVDGLGKLVQMLGIPPQELWERVPGAPQQDVERWKATASQGDASANLAAMLDRQAADELPVSWPARKRATNRAPSTVAPSSAFAPSPCGTASGSGRYGRATSVHSATWSPRHSRLCSPTTAHRPPWPAPSTRRSVPPSVSAA